jgi:hypothetical protein
MFQPSKETLAILEDLERRIDPAGEEEYLAQWRDFLFDRFEGSIFTPRRPVMTAPGTPLPHININDALADYDLMLRHQLSGVSHTLNSPTTSPALRANYGSAILSSLFGAELFVMPYHTDTLPTTRCLGDTDKIRDLVERGIPPLRTSLGEKTFAFGEIWAELSRRYPNVHRYVAMYHPDLQGPLDIAELLWGGEMFYAMYDEPELVHAFLSLITETYTAFMEEWFKLFPPDPEMNPHWGILYHRGTIALRDDSAMNLSPALYEEFALPYDQKLLEHFDGGIVHFCGRGDHYIPALCRANKLYGINMSQPEYNDMEIIYRNTVDKGIPLLCFSPPVAQRDQHRPGGFHGHLQTL